MAGACIACSPGRVVAPCSATNGRLLLPTIQSEQERSQPRDICADNAALNVPSLEQIESGTILRALPQGAARSCGRANGRSAIVQLDRRVSLQKTVRLSLLATNRLDRSPRIHLHCRSLHRISVYIHVKRHPRRGAQLQKPLPLEIIISFGLRVSRSKHHSSRSTDQPPGDILGRCGADHKARQTETQQYLPHDLPPTHLTFLNMSSTREVPQAFRSIPRTFSSASSSLIHASAEDGCAAGPLMRLPAPPPERLAADKRAPGPVRLLNDVAQHCAK